MTELETGTEMTFSTAATSYTVPLLHPYYTYECIVTAYTVATGPYAEIIVMTPEDSEFNDCSLHVSVIMHRNGYVMFFSCYSSKWIPSKLYSN